MLLSQFIVLSLVNSNQFSSSVFEIDAKVLDCSPSVALIGFADPGLIKNAAPMIFVLLPNCRIVFVLYPTPFSSKYFANTFI